MRDAPSTWCVEGATPSPVSYDLEVLALVHEPIDLDALVAAVRVKSDLVALVPHGKGLADDGAGFVIERTQRGAKLSAGNERGPRDEWAMEWCACVLAGSDGVVIDRHTGRQWSTSLLEEWLRVSALLSGRALASNVERIAHARVPVATEQFASRVEAITRHGATTGVSAALRARIHDELQPYVARAQFTWIAARGLANVGDLAAIEQLTRTQPHGSEPDPFVVAAQYGALAVAVFARALSDADPNHRRAAARALHHLHHPDALGLVVRALDDRRSTVREAVLEADFDEVMTRAGAREVLAPSLAKLARDPSTMVRRRVAKWVEV